MKNHIKIAVSLLLAFICAFACVSCNANATADNRHSNVESANAFLDGTSGSDVVAANDISIEDIQNSYRIRFLYSYTAKMDDGTGRTEIKSKVVTVKSFFIPKSNPVVTDEIKAQIPALKYRGFTFDALYTQWDKTTQTGVAGTEFNYENLTTVSADMDIYCSRGDLAGVDAHWYIEGTTLYITGTGEMFDAVDANELDLPWYKEVDSIDKIVISDGITYIGNNSFKEMTAVKSVEIADSVQRIGESAFEKCAITRLKTPASLTRIEKNAFNGTKLVDVVLNDGLVSLADRAFYGSNKIRTIVVPASLKEIGIAAFHPGAVGSKNYTHALSKVYYGGSSAEDFKKIKISLDNAWFNEKPTIFYYSESEAIGNYWHYAGENNVPVQYCFTLSYRYGQIPAPVATIFVPATPVLDAEGNLKYDVSGQPMLEGKITYEHIRQQKNIVYNNMSFAGFSGANAISVGDKITSDKNYTCQRGSILSHEGGVLWTLSNGVLTIYAEDRAVLEEKIANDIATRNAQECGILLTDFERDVYAQYIATKSAQTFEQAKQSLISRENSDAGLVLSEEEAADFKNARLSAAYRMWDFVESTDAASLWTGKLATVASISGVVVSEGVEYIGRYTFSSISKFQEIVLPSTLNGIHAEAFVGCTSLVTIYYEGDINTKCSSINALTGINATAYSKVTEGSANDGNFWISYSTAAGKKLAWSLQNGKITIGGDAVMYNFASAEEAPWYAAKNKITSVAFAQNITSIATYAFYNYSGVNSLSIPSGTKIIPATAFAGTGIVTNTSGEGTKYDRGMLIIQGHLIKVDPEKAKGILFETANKTYNIADGAFADCTSIERIFIARTVQHVNPNAFTGTNLKYIFADSVEAAWNNAVTNVNLTGVTVYFKSTTAPKEAILDSNGKQIGTKITENKYWNKCGNEYVIWGCTHVFGEYVNDNNATCMQDATETAKCTIGSCGEVHTRIIPDSKSDEHNFVNSDGTASDTCVVPGCNTKKEVAVISDDE